MKNIFVLVPQPSGPLRTLRMPVAPSGLSTWPLEDRINQQTQQDENKIDALTLYECDMHQYRNLTAFPTINWTLKVDARYGNATNSLLPRCKSSMTYLLISHILRQDLHQ